jgi:hypothetical protein
VEPLRLDDGDVGVDDRRRPIPTSSRKQKKVIKGGVTGVTIVPVEPVDAQVTSFPSDERARSVARANLVY